MERQGLDLAWAPSVEPGWWHLGDRRTGAAGFAGRHVLVVPAEGGYHGAVAQAAGRRALGPAESLETA